jgi:CPA1 family monovalent cation:H+ antiporter
VTALARFEFILLLVAASIALVLLARRLRLPEAATLIIGGLCLALLPGMPDVEMDPEFALVFFLPPLLLLSAYQTDWRAFRADLRIILQLAIGAVVFTTFAIGLATHWLLPMLPWGACFALGAIVAPPDAVAAKAVLQGLPLPSRVVTLLEGESLLNDATGLVLYRLAVVAALTGAFHGASIAKDFLILVVGGIPVGFLAGLAASTIIGRLHDNELGIATGFLAAWGSYLAADRLHVSGVIATVACGIVMGWRQHALYSAEKRMHARSVWRVISFILESLIFILIGLSLRAILHRFASHPDALLDLLGPILAIIAVLVLSRFVWIFTATYVVRFFAPGLRKRDPYPPVRNPLVMSWAGMRGVVSLAAALALPDDFPGRDIILIATFAIILVTVIVQGSTLAPLIRLLGFDGSQTAPFRQTLPEREVRLLVAKSQAGAARLHSAQDDGSHRHPRLVEQYEFKVGALTRSLAANGALESVRTDHYDAILSTIEAGREALLRLHRAGDIDNHVLRVIERELDAEEIRAHHLKASNGMA